MKQLVWTLPLLLAACAPMQQMDAAPMAPGTPTPGATTPAPSQPPTREWKAVPYLSATPVRSFSAAQQVTDPSEEYRAVLNTARGPITLELYPQQAPKAVNNFVFLALNHFYDGTRFHRVIDGFMAQGGDPLSADPARQADWGTGDPGYSFRYEVGNNLSFGQPGVLGMARSASPDSQGSQFFITLAPSSFLDGQYTVFGRVVDGMDVLNSITKTSASSGYGEQPIPGAQADLLNSVTILSR